VTKPIRLQPQYKEMIWGGNKLQSHFGRTIPSELTGESWEVHSDNLILGTNVQLKTIAKDASLMGEKIANCEVFPLLVKLITAQRDLSVQVHPDDDYAQRVEGEPNGKTECWYILDAPEKAQLIVGVNPEINDIEQLKMLIEKGEVLSGVNYLSVKAGDFLYIPAGTVHAITQGITLLEIQQTSDTTYRIYDYERTDSSGNLRELHINKALDVISLSHIANPIRGTTKGGGTTLIDNAFFTVKKYVVDGAITLNMPSDSASTITCTAGEVVLTGGEYTEKLYYGDTLIWPVGCASVQVAGSQSEMIAVYL